MSFKGNSRSLLLLSASLSLLSPGFVQAQDTSLETSLPLDVSWRQEPVLLDETPAKPAKAPPLPVHTIEGYGGGAITPTAYLANPGAPGTAVGLPSFSVTGVYIGHAKNLESLVVTETFFNHLELGYAFSRFGIGSAQSAIKDATGVTVRDDVYLHNFNARLNFLNENSFKASWIPAVTAGVHYKYNDGIDEIDDKLGGALTGIGLDRNDGVDFTLTASKLLPDVFGHPLIVTAGLRSSQAAWLGYLGFGEDRSLTFEGSLIYLPTNWLAVGYEFRQKNNPYDLIPGLVGDEDNLHALSFIFMPNNHLNIALVYGAFGEVLETNENHALAVQVKWEF